MSIPSPRRRSRLPLTLALFGLAFALRLFQLRSVPLGAHGDVAWNSLIALDWLRYGEWLFYVYHLYAPEPAIIYLTALSFALTGKASFFTARLVTALAGALTIPAIMAALYWLSRDLTPNRPAGSSPPLSQEKGGSETMLVGRALWLAALSYAISFHPILLSKSGQRAQTFPLLVALLTLLVARAWRTGRWRYFIAAAVVMALANYTYIPARLLPLMVIAWVIHQIVVDRATFRARLVQVIGMGALSAVLVLPQLVMYFRAPESFMARASQTAGQFIFQSGLPGEALWATLGLKLLGELGILFFPWRGAYAEMPYSLLALPLALGFLIAVGLTFARPQDKALWWPLIGLPFMFLTDVLSGTQPQPHGLRMIGMLPLAFMMAAQGLSRLWAWLETRLPRKLAPLVSPALVGLIVATEGLHLWQYYGVFVPADRTNPELTYLNEAADSYIAQLALEHAADGTPVLITADDFQRANVTFLLSSDFPDRGSAILPSGELAVQWEGPVRIIVPARVFRPRHDGRPPEHDFREWAMLYRGRIWMLPPLYSWVGFNLLNVPDSRQPVGRVMDESGQIIAQAYEVNLTPADFDLTRTEVGANLGDEITLAAYHADSPILLPGEPLWLALYWEAQRDPAEDYEVFVQVWDAAGNPVVSVHRWTLDGVFRTSLWRPGEWIPTRYRLDLPADLPPGLYQVVAGLYRVLENEPLPVLDAAGNAAGPQVVLSGFRVKRPPAEVTRPAPDAPIIFGDLIELAGYDLDMTDEAVTLAADWRALGHPTANYTLFVHVVDESGEIVAQIDVQPLGGAYPTLAWDGGEVIPDTYTIALPPDLPPGEYAIYVGWYTLPDGIRLRATVGGAGVAEDRVRLDTITR